MLKYSVFLYFFIATVSGQLQNQLHRDLSLASVDQSEASQGVSPGLVNSGSPKPCRRRNNVENNNVLSPNANWMKNLQSQIAQPLNQKVSDESDEVLEKGKPQSLNAYTVSVQQDKNKPVQKDTHRDSGENDVHLTAIGDTNNQLDTELCQKSDENENDVENDYDRNSSNKPVPSKVHKEVLELLSKCVKKEKDGNHDDGDDSEGNSRRSNNEVNENKQSENNYAYEPSKSNENKRIRKFRNKKLNSNEEQVQPKHPAQGEGISALAESRVLLLHNSRVCFACTTSNDPSCWNPDQTTTVKYCKKEDDACITKTFKARNELITIRDCGNSCTDSDSSGVPLRYKSCHICHSDQCNGADALTSLNMMLVAFIISAIKFMF